MGVNRNGARTFLNLMKKACALSHLPGFRTALFTILGDSAGSFFAVWDPCCAVVDTLVAADNWFNQKDYHADVAGNEDIVPA